MKLSTDGDFVDGLAFGGGFSDHSVEMFLDDDGFFLAHTGDTIGPGNGAGGIARLDYNLNLVWNKMYGSSGEEAIGDIVQRPDGTFMLFGDSEMGVSENGFISQVNAEGDILWTRLIQADFSIDRITDALFLPDDSYVLSMASFSLDRVVLAKFDALHQLLWAKVSTFGTSSSVEPRAENQVLEGNDVFSITNVEGIGLGGYDLEVDRYDSSFGPCDWEDIALEIELVEFDQESIEEEGVIGGSLIAFELIRNDLDFDTISISDCYSDYCQFEGVFDLPSLCEGEEGLLNYELTVAPPGQLIWEWQIDNELTANQELLFAPESIGSIPISLFITAVDLPDCIQQIDTFIVVDPIPVFNILGAEVLCAGEIGAFEVDNVVGEVLWSNGDIGPSIEDSFTEDAVIEVTMGMNACLATQAINVQVVQYPTGSIIAPSLICVNDQIVFSVEGDFTDVLWGNGDSSETLLITASSDSTMSVSFANDMCITEDSYDFFVMHPSEINTAMDLSLCAGAVHQLSASGGEDYLWSNGAAGAQANYMILTDSIVWVEGYNACGGETIEISISAEQPSALGLDTIVVFGEYGEVQVIELPSAALYNVYNGIDLVCESCASLVFEIQGDEIYDVVYVDEFGCEIASSVVVNTLPCTDVFLPNSFSPNDDGVNDYFTPVLRESCVDYFDFRIYDRWGSLVFSSNDPIEKWAGDGISSEDYYSTNNTYSYRLVYSLIDSYDVIEKLGSVTLIR